MAIKRIRVFAGAVKVNTFDNQLTVWLYKMEMIHLRTKDANLSSINKLPASVWNQQRLNTIETFWNKHIKVVLHIKTKFSQVICVLVSIANKHLNLKKLKNGLKKTLLMVQLQFVRNVE